MIKRGKIPTIAPDADKERTTRIYVLCMRGTNYHKIGVAKDVAKRMASIQTGCPVPLVLVWVSDRYYTANDARRIESDVHHAFREYRSGGSTAREWFQFSAYRLREALEEIVRLCVAREQDYAQRKHTAELATAIQTIAPLPEGYDIPRRYILLEGCTPEEIHPSTVARIAREYCTDYALPVLETELVPDVSTQKPRKVLIYPREALEHAFSLMLERRYRLPKKPEAPKLVIDLNKHRNRYSE